MKKRFVDVDRWRTPWFRGLSPDAKHAWSYLCDNCDLAGVWEADTALADFSIGKALDWPAVLAEIGGRLAELPGGKLWIKKFVPFQYGELTAKSPPHRGIIACIKKHGLELLGAECARGIAPAERIEELAREQNGRLELPEPEEGVTCMGALADIQGIDRSRATEATMKKLTHATHELFEIEPRATPEMIYAARDAYRRKYKSAAVTAMALVNHWSEITPRQPTPEEIEERETLKRQLAEAERQLKGFMTPNGLSARADLTDLEIDEARDLQDIIASIKGKL